MKRLVLVGAGHAHAHVLFSLAQRSNSDLEIILVSPIVSAPYSGMIPGWLAGHYTWRDCCMDFESLCQMAGAKIRCESVTALDPDIRELSLTNGEQLSYDWLSLNIGSTLRPEIHFSELHDIRILPMRPLSALRKSWGYLEDTVRALVDGSDYKVVMVGGGAAGVESILAAHHRLTQIAPHVRCHFTLVTRGKEILSGMPARAVRILRKHLEHRGITILNNFSVKHMENDSLVGLDGHKLPADAVLWATGAQAHLWPGESSLSTDQDGFIEIDTKLRSLSHQNVFATGDCARWAQALPKAGVFSVRMGPVLAANLCAAIDQKPFLEYRPQSRYLVLIGTGGSYAVAVWGPLSWQGAWVWNWKEKIDRSFLLSHKKSAAGKNQAHTSLDFPPG